MRAGLGFGIGGNAIVLGALAGFLWAFLRR